MMHTDSHVGVTCIYCTFKMLAIAFDFKIHVVGMAQVILLVWSGLFKKPSILEFESRLWQRILCLSFMW